MIFSLQRYYQIAGTCLPWIGFFSIIFMIYGIYGGLFLAPSDYQQGDAFRIIYIHVPCAFLSLGIYTILFFNAIIYLVWHTKINDIIASTSAGIGAAFTFLALFTGALWGKPMWGTWWIWDARLTSELILFFLYLGYMALRSAIRNRERAAKSSAILAIVGMIDIPIIHFSVEWWTTLHQGATLSRLSKPTIASEMLYPLLAMIVALFLFYIAILLFRVRTEILKREWRNSWVMRL